ncbi:MAG: exo-alpha-sialidase [Candidatus Omnitrophica bacterium]|nr:exo-alpha-sialidase [Candidatus Omnitrophota bacterium]
MVNQTGKFCHSSIRASKIWGLPTVFVLILFSSLPICSEPLYEENLMFPLQEKHVHSSCIVECPNGDLLACWFHGSGERTASDVLIQGARLRRGAKAWSPVFEMADTPEIPDCNPVLFVDEKKELRLFWIAVLGDHWEESILRYRISADYQNDGPPTWQWQDMIILKPGESFAQDLENGFRQLDLPEIDYGGYAPHPLEALVKAARQSRNRQKGWMTRTHLLTLPSGRILLPLYSDGFYVGLTAISDDGGASWRAGSPMVGVGLNQPSVVRKKNGVLVAYMRDEGPAPKRVQISESKDDGETWSVAVESDIPNPDSSLEVIALEDSRWVMAYNDQEEGRDRLALALSDNEGETWKWKRHLEIMEGGGFHYPSLIQTRDGLIHISYTYQPGRSADKSIKHVAVNADWILQGE